MLDNPCYRAWRACFTSRWHCGDHAAELAHTNDCVGCHSGRMAILALHFWGDDTSRDLLAAIALHDLGESDVCDISYTARRKWPELADLIRDCESKSMRAMGFRFPDLTSEDATRLHFLDRLDAWYYVQLRAPAITETANWRRIRAWLKTTANNLGVNPGISIRDV